MGKINFKEATVPTTLNEGELVVVDGVPYFGDSNGVVPANVSGLERWKVKFSDAQEWTISAEGFGGLFEFPDKTLGFMFRIGSKHGLSQSTLYFARSKDIYGLEWNDKIEVDTIEGNDIRNGSVGIGEDGTIIGVFASRAVSDGAHSGPILYYSTDNGLNWTKDVIGTPATNGGNGHGGIVETDDKYLFTLYGGGLTGFNICAVDKNVSNFEIIKNYTNADLEAGLDSVNFNLTEVSIIRTNSTTIFGIVRNQSTGGTVEFYSQDNGVTWSELFLSTVDIGLNPPILKVEDNFVYLNYPSRQSGSLNEEIKSKYLMTYKPIIEITESSKNWIAYKRLFDIPIDNGTSGLQPRGNVERGFIFKRNNSLFLMWAEGNYMDDGLGGESVHFIKNIGKFN